MRRNMILDFFDKNELSAEVWEKLCDESYSIKVKGLWYKVPQIIERLAILKSNFKEKGKCK